MSAECDPVDILNQPDVSTSSSSASDTDTRILARNAVPALETRYRRYALSVDRVATIRERALSPLSRFSIEELVGFLNDAAIQVATRVKATYLRTLRTTKNPSVSIWNFSDTFRLLGKTVTTDGVTIANRIPEDQREDILSRGSTVSLLDPVYTLENGIFNVYAEAFRNPATANVDVIRVPQKTTLTATGSISGNIFSRTTGDLIDEDLHVLIPVKFTNSLGESINGVVESGSTTFQQMTTLFDATGWVSSGSIVATWETPIFSSLSEILESLVIECAAIDMFAAMPDIQAMTAAIQSYERELESLKLDFFKLPGIVE